MVRTCFQITAPCVVVKSVVRAFASGFYRFLDLAQTRVGAFQHEAPDGHMEAHHFCVDRDDHIVRVGHDALRLTALRIPCDQLFSRRVV